MAVARARGKLKGKQPKLSERQQKELCRMHDTGDYSINSSQCHARPFTGCWLGSSPPYSDEESPPLYHGDGTASSPRRHGG